jgi:hypothetical protein
MDKEGRALLGFALSAGLLASTVIATRAFVRVKADETIEVTGSAKRRIRSDLISWSAKVSTRGTSMSAAYHALSGNMPKLTAWLERHGIPRTELKVSSVSSRAIHPRNKEGHELEDTIAAYVMEQQVTVSSSDVEKVEAASRGVTELIDQDIDVESEAPNYHYTKLADLKIQMLAEAAKDARTRAEQLALSTGARIGPLRQARMGVIQINPADSTETSNEGNNDTTSLDKDIITVVGATFALE